MTDASTDPHPEPVTVAAYPDLGEAEVTRAHLEANGIVAVIVDEVEGGALPVEGEAGVAVLVPAKDAALAREILGLDVGDVDGQAEDTDDSSDDEG